MRSFTLARATFFASASTDAEEIVAAHVLAAGADPVALLDVGEVDLERVDELDDLDDPAAVVAVELRELLLGEERVLALGDLVAFANLVPAEIAMALGAAPHHLDPRAALLVELVELGRQVLGRRVKLRRDRDEAERNFTGPERAHLSLSSRSA